MESTPSSPIRYSGYFVRVVTAPLPTLRNKQVRSPIREEPQVVKCKEHAAAFLRKLGYKVRDVYWVESAGDSGEGLDTIGYVNLDGNPRRAFVEQDTRARTGGTKDKPRWRVQGTKDGW